MGTTLQKLTNRRFQRVEAVKPPTLQDMLGGEHVEPLSEAEIAGTAALNRLADIRMKQGDAAFLARRAAIKAAEDARDAAILRRVAER